MRKDTSLLPAEGEGVTNETEGASMESGSPEDTGTSPVSAVAAQPGIAAPERPRRAGKFTAMMALEEPARTDALEKAANSGMTVNLRSKSGEEVRIRYGEHVLVVPATPKPFATAHAIHLLFCAGDLVEEVEG